MTFSICSLSAEDLSAVDALMKKNSATLGFLPYEALSDYQRRGGIIGAKIEGDQLVGYLIYSIHHNYFRIVHLCVSEHHRGKNIARKFIDHLRASATTQRLIKLHCRRDYSANAMWPILGFVPVHEKPGRSSAGHLLTHWTLTLAQDRQLGLFRALALDDHLNAVVDAQVFFDLYEPESKKALPSNALLSDFLFDTLSLWATDELLVEIDRKNNRAQREVSRKRAYEFQFITHELTLAEHFETVLRKLLPSNTNSQISDIRHLAKTAASDSNTFITRDKKLLNRADEILGHVNVNVLSPTQLIVRVFELAKKSRHKITRISGTTVSWRKLNSADLSQFPTASFVEPWEKHWPFTENLNAFLARPDCYECSALQIQGEIVGLRVLNTLDNDCVNVPFFTVSRTYDRGLLERFVISDTITKAITTNRSIVEFERDGLSQRIISSLLHTGFIKRRNAFVKLTLPDFLTREQALSRISSIVPDLCDEFQSKDNFELQRICSPLCLEGATKTFMFPIRSGYAMGLFDLNQACQDLFGGKTSALFRWDNVYYRKATHSRLIQAPGRIFWYVSAPQKRVVAISNLDAVKIDTPKNLFRTYQKFGVLDWEEIYRMCNGEVSKKLMAIEFSHTILFKSPISLNELGRIYGNFKRRPVLQSPSKIPAGICEAIVRRGFEVHS